MMQGPSRESLAGLRERLSTRARTAPHQLPQLSESLLGFADLVDREVALRRALSDPALDRDAKTRLVDALLGQRLDPASLEVVHDLVSVRWTRSLDLRDAAETLGVLAALQVVQAEGALDDVEDQLFRFGRIVDREPALRAALTDRAIPLENKLGLLRDLLRGRAHPTTVRLVDLAVTSPRGRTIDDAMADFTDLAAGLRERIVAVVRSAVPLSAEQTTRLTSALTRMFGREVQVQAEVDPAVFGGVSVHVGDEVIDGTVARRLDTVRRAIAPGR